MTITTKSFFDPQTATFSYVVVDQKTQKAAVIDSVLNYDQDSGRTYTKSADEVIYYIKSQKLELQWILETHIHADHLTAANYIHKQLGGKLGIGSQIKQVLDLWVPIFNTAGDTPLNATEFDQLFEDNEIFQLGEVNIRVLHTPGHTPACASYVIEDTVFVGDLIFMPDVGTGRADFPGGSAAQSYDSIQRIYDLPDETKIYTCHDYPTEGRAVSCISTVKEQKQQNILLKEHTAKQQYVANRNQRDQGKSVPKLLLPSVQVNLRAGTFGKPEDNGVQYIKIPVNKI